MRKRGSFFAVLVGLVVVAGIGLIVVAFKADRQRYDRETDLAAAKYDGEKLLTALGEIPGATPLEVPELESARRHQALDRPDGIWMAWRQRFAMAGTFAEVVSSHAAVVEPLGWKADGTGENGERAVFSQGSDWTLTLERLTSAEGVDGPAADAAGTGRLEFRRELRFEKVSPKTPAEP